MRIVFPFFVASALLFATSIFDRASAEERSIDFVRDVQPILADRCYECHGAKKQKGRLRLDVRSGVFDEHGDSPILEVGDPAMSLLIELVELDASDPDIMPAEGDPLTAEQIRLLRTWIEEGADWPQSADVVEAPKVDDGLQARTLTDDETTAETAAIAAIHERGGLAIRIAENTNVVDVNLSLLGEAVSDDDLKLLGGLEKTLVWLNLARTKVGDSGIETLSRFPELRRLNLSNSAITDAAIPHLTKLTNLEYLNLYGTKITDDGAAGLATIPSLRRVYLWQTEVTAEGAAKLAETIPDLMVDRGDYVDKPVPPLAENTSDTPKPINEKCPVSGADAKPDVTVEHDGKLIAFCCNDCKAKFEADPKPFLTKLGLAAATPPKESRPTPKPINEKCPVSGADAKPDVTVEHDGKLIAFCCNDCKAKFEADPKPFLTKLGLLAATPPQPDAPTKPINSKCPVTGRDVKRSYTAEYDGKLVAFCCNNCKAKFNSDPKPFLEKLGIK